MDKKLITLEQHTHMVMTRESEKKYNGIACPECGSELFDPNDIIYDSYPAQVDTQCSGCEYRGMRFI